MSVAYSPLSQLDLEALAGLEGFSPVTWNGPALPVPQGEDGLKDLVQVFNLLLARGQYLIQAQDALDLRYTLNGVTEKAERFLFGTENQVESAAVIRAAVLAIESLFKKPGLTQEFENVLLSHLAKLRNIAEHLFAARASQMNLAQQPARTNSDDVDLTALPLEGVDQFSMAWTRLDDVARIGFPHVAAYVDAVNDPKKATENFWHLFSSTALPLNLLVMQRLQESTVEPYRTNFGASWLPLYQELLKSGDLYGIDMTIFRDLAPATLSNGTVRFTPSSMVLIRRRKLDGGKVWMEPVGVYVADPQDSTRSAVYTPDGSAWIYGLLAAKTSLTVYGIWLGHVYTWHLISAAMQMAMWNTLPTGHILHQMLAPQSNFTIEFDAILLAAWQLLAPPTSIDNSGKFLSLCQTFAGRHDFFSLDLPTRLDELGLNVADFTAKDDWDQYPNVQKMQSVWKLTTDYVKGVVEGHYKTDQDVVSDAALQTWINVASSSDGGNIAGLPQVTTVDLLVRVLTSLLYRINVHGCSRLRSSSAPELSFVTNWPVCLQSTDIPGAHDTVTTNDLLSKYLPVTGTIGKFVAFVDTFAFSEPYVSFVPVTGAETSLFFDGGANHSGNIALEAVRTGFTDLVKQWQPDWVQVSQWPLNIEL